jgi:nucleoside-diphosphate-sugar epimerase
MTLPRAPKNVAIIGGSGFIGTRLCGRLVGNPIYELRILDKVKSYTFPSKWVHADVRDKDSLSIHVQDSAIIINLAAEHRDDVRPKELYDEVNVDGARNIVNVAREKNVRTIIFTSSVAVYGSTPSGATEGDVLAPSNDYGRTKMLAEECFRLWQLESPSVRTLVIVRPTVVFGERNRGNVYNLLRQIVSGVFVMIGSGENRKSMAYVENVAAFIEHALALPSGIHIFNYVDKPDFAMNALVKFVRAACGMSGPSKIRIPYWFAYGVGIGADLAARIFRTRFSVSAVRIKKFCTETIFETSVASVGFVPPVSLEDALRRTIKHEFISRAADDKVFYSE